jgi:hypothetical protein
MLIRNKQGQVNLKVTETPAVMCLKGSDETF